MIVPRIVFDEVVVAGAGHVGADEVRAASWLRIEDAPVGPSLRGLLDAGEAAAIPLAARLGATILGGVVRAPCSLATPPPIL